MDTHTIGQNLGSLTVSTHGPAVEVNGALLIPHQKLDQVTEMIQEVIAEVVVTWIDAGSERDAVMENEKLRAAIREELLGWSNDPSVTTEGPQLVG